MKVTIRLFFFALVLLVFSCSEENGEIASPQNGNSTGVNAFEWTIPANQVLDGGVGKDGIPSIDAPKFSPIQEITTIPDWEFVVALRVGNEMKVYPHNILDWHEIVNDRIGGKNIALTYCPLTGTAIAWERGENTFGVSGMLYNSNLIPYDRLSGSYWSQMLNESVRGVRVEEKTERIPVMEFRWQNFKSEFPEAQVMNRNTGFDRDYDTYPYGSYRGSSDLLFPVAHQDDRLFAKERVLGVQIEGLTRVYPFDSFEESSFLYDQFPNEEIVVFGNRQMGFMASYSLMEIDGEAIIFSEVSEQSIHHFVSDQFGNLYNAFGEIVEGPHLRIKLAPTPSYMGFYFAWAAFNPDLEIF